jgi:hypothetical protein
MNPTGVAAKLFGLAIPAWVYEVLIGIVATVGVILFLEHRGATHELDKLKVSSAHLIAKANTDIQNETNAHNADVKANQGKIDAALAANATLTADLARSVSLFDAYRRAHPDVARPTGGSGPAVSGECGARSCGDLASELAVRGNELAGSVGALSATLQGCQRDRDSLTGLPH